MEPRELEEIEQFLNQVGQPSLFEYVGLDREGDAGTADGAIKKRRSWAQGQQANPKFKAEALWVIKNQVLLRKALLEDRAGYLRELERRDQGKKLQTLSTFIHGTLAAGVLTPRAEQVIRDKGRELGLPDAIVHSRIEEMLSEHGISRSEDSGPVSVAGPFVDFYALLEVPPDSSSERVEEAYRARYRWARTLRDTTKAQEIYAQLDEAWKVLKDPGKRAQYDAQHRKRAPAGAPSPPRESLGPLAEVEPVGFLPGPKPQEVASPQSTRGSASRSGAAPPRPSDPGSAGLKLKGAPLPPAEPGDRPSSAGLAGPTARRAPPDARRGPAPRDAAEGERDGGRGPPLAQVQPIADEAPPQRASVTGPRPEGLREAVRASAAARPKAETTPRKAAAPKPPPDLAGPTVGLGEKASAARAKATPKLEIPDADELQVRGGRKSETISFTVKNTGSGKMAGRIRADREWVEVTPEELDSSKREQEIEVTVHLGRMPKNKAAAIVSVATDHGERRTITIQAERKAFSLGAIVAIVLGLILLALVVAVGAAALAVLRAPAPAPQKPTVLAVQVDPPEGEVYVGGTLVGAKGSIDLTDGFPVGTPFELRVELDGFKTWRKTITATAGGREEVRVDLELSDPMDWKPMPNHEEGTLEMAEVTSRLDARAERIEACFTRNLADRPGFEAATTVSAIVNAKGYVAAVSFDGRTYDVPQVDDCLRRELRALRMPLVKDGDYARFDRTWKVQVPSAAPAGADVAGSK